MEETLISLLKELNKAYPDSIPIRTLKENGHKIVVIDDAIKGKLVESITIPSLVDDPKLNNKEMALRISIKGFEFMKYNSDNPNFSTHKGDTNFNFTGNNNTFAIGQSQGQAKIDQSKEINQSGVVLPQHDLFETIFLKLGENLLKILSGSLENGIYKVRYISWFIILSNIFAVVYAFWAKMISLMLVAFFILFFIILIFNSLIRFSSENRRCEKCNKYFAYRTMKKTILGDGEYKGERVYNIKKIAKCRFCGNEQIFSVIETDARVV